MFDLSLPDDRPAPVELRLYLRLPGAADERDLVLPVDAASGAIGRDHRETRGMSA